MAASNPQARGAGALPRQHAPISRFAVAPALPEDGAPSASLDHPKAPAAPTPLTARPEQLGSLPRPQELASGRPKVEEAPLPTATRHMMARHDSSFLDASAAALTRLPPTALACPLAAGHRFNHPPEGAAPNVKPRTRTPATGARGWVVRTRGWARGRGLGPGPGATRAQAVARCRHEPSTPALLR